MLATIAITIGVMAAGVIAGALVQKVTHFLDPIDFFTAAIACAVPLVYWVQSSGMLDLPADAVWGWPFLAGYMAGYAVSGRVDYIMIRTFSGSKTTSAEPYIFYRRGDGTYLQEQTWSGLAKRLFLGIGHEAIVTNGDLTPDWLDVAKWPHFPRREHGEIVAEKVETYIRDRPHTRIPRPKAYVTVITRASGSSVSTADLVRDRNALQKANRLLVEAQNENFALKQSLNMKLADSVAYFLSRVYSKAPGASFLDVMKKWSGKPEQDKANSKESEDNGKTD